MARVGEGMRRRALLTPALGLIFIFMVLPLCIMVYVSFLARSYYGGVDWATFSPEAYVRIIFERQLDDSLAVNLNYVEIFLRSFWLSLITTVLCLALGFPTALYMATRGERWREVMIFLVTVPFWTNLLVRNYAWILILRDHGLINGTLQWLGIISEPLPLLYTDGAVAVGLTYSFLPFMVLPIYASLEKTDWRLVEASFDLYANRWRTLRRVVVPLSVPGIVAGCILVFIPSLGAYVTPELLGGGKTLMIGNLIGLQFGAARNWPFGASLGFVLLALVLTAMTVYALKSRPGERKG
jgi:spermidine/putrescine transport system permease protein